MTSAEDALWDLRQGGRRLERYVEDFLELSNWVSWHNAALGACFQLGLDDEIIRCDLPISDFPLIELINLVLFLNGSDFDVEEVWESPKSRRPAPAGTHHVSPAHPTPKTSTYCTNGSDHLPNPKCPSILLSSTLVLSQETPKSTAKSKPPSAAKSKPPSAANSSPPSAVKSRPPSAAHSSPLSAGNSSPPSAGNSMPLSAGNSRPPSAAITSPPPFAALSNPPPFAAHSSPPSVGKSRPLFAAHSSPAVRGEIKAAVHGNLKPAPVCGSHKLAARGSLKHAAAFGGGSMASAVEAGAGAEAAASEAVPPWPSELASRAPHPAMAS